jgi:DNA-directed RNA polymerase subunit RPC12/RpoP
MENEKTTIFSYFSCTHCNYYTNYKKDYNKHLLTKKHLKNLSINTNTNTTATATATTNTFKSAKKYKCDNCPKEYSHRQSLHFHRNKCTGHNVVKETEMNKILNAVTNQNTLVETFVENQQTLVEKQTSLIENQTSLINELMN